MITDDILDAVENAVVATTPATDTGGAPAQFRHLTAFESLKASTVSDRVFTVSLNRGDPDGWRDGTGTAGVGHYVVNVDVAVRYQNEGRTVRAFEKILAEDRRRIIDKVPVYVRVTAAITGCGECVYTSGSIQDVTARVVVSGFTFRVEYVDTITS